MPTVRPGNQAAVIVVDAQVGVLAAAENRAEVVRNIQLVVNNARQKNVPVVWVQHSNQELPEGSAVWQIVPELTPAPDEAIVAKRYNSAFEETRLEDHLAGARAAQLVLCGAATNWCIRATAYAAVERGYDVTLVSDAHAAEPVTRRDGSTVDGASIIADLNTAFTWLEYPGRTTRALPASEITFAG